MLLKKVKRNISSEIYFQPVEITLYYAFATSYMDNIHVFKNLICIQKINLYVSEMYILKKHFNVVI